MIKARIKLNNGELVTKVFESKGELSSFLSYGHELLKAMYIR